MKSDRRTALVTGATGAIGMALLELLEQEEWNVCVLMNPQSDRNERMKKFHNAQLIPCSLKEISGLDVSLMEYSFDCFFHLAWMGASGAARNNWSLQVKNIEYTLDAVRLAGQLGCKTFVGCGSQAEYGPVNTRLSADTPTVPETGYGMAKLCAGQMSRKLCEELGIKHIWTRILSVYGPFDGENTMVISGLRKMISNEETAFSDGTQKWDYLYCKDAAKALYLLALKGEHGRTYPLGSGQCRPLREYIEIMARESQYKLQPGLGKIQRQPGRLEYLCADTEWAEKIGFMPETGFDEGIRQTINWIKQQ